MVRWPAPLLGTRQSARLLFAGCAAGAGFSARRARADPACRAANFRCTIGYGPHAQSFITQGAPIEWVGLEPVVVIVNTVSLAAKAPHPAAARLLIDFLFSKAAQTKLRELNRIPARVDVEADPPRLLKGFKTIAQDLESEGMAESIEQFQQIFGLRMK